MKINQFSWDADYRLYLGQRRKSFFLAGGIVFLGDILDIIKKEIRIKHSVQLAKTNLINLMVEPVLSRWLFSYLFVRIDVLRPSQQQWS